MGKKELLEEAAILGIEDVGPATSNKDIQAAIDSVLDEAPEASESDEVAEEEPEAAPLEEVADEEPSDVPAPTFTLDQLKPFAEQLFGVGGHVLVGARSAGFIPAGRVTREEAKAGIDRYLNMPVEQGKEG